MLNKVPVLSFDDMLSHKVRSSLLSTYHQDEGNLVKKRVIPLDMTTYLSLLLDLTSTYHQFELNETKDE